MRIERSTATYHSHELPHSAIHVIDLRYLDIPQAVGAFVVFDRQRRLGPVLIETGPASTLPALKEGLAKLGLALGDIRHALVTHIHLDHAGAAGELAHNGTHIHVHEFGAPHLINPAKLISSARRIYGDQTQRLWGTITPIPPSHVHPVHDGDVLDVEGLRFRAIETPGHARHHHAFALDNDGEKIGFVGDAAGFNARAVSETLVSVPTPPPEFDLEAWLATIDRLQAERFDALYLTHFGRVVDVSHHLDRLREVLINHAAFVRTRFDAGQHRDSILTAYIEWNRDDAARHGLGDDDFARYVSRNLLTMNVDGMLRYWGRQAGA